MVYVINTINILHIKIKIEEILLRKNRKRLINRKIIRKIKKNKHKFV